MLQEGRCFKKFMKHKIAILFFVLLVFAIIHAILQKRPSEIYPFKKITQKRTGSIKITDESNKRQTPLQKEKDKGFVCQSTSRKFLANKSRVLNLIENLEKLKLEAVISTKPEEHFKYGVSTANCVLVKIDERTPEILIGKTGPDAQSFYARFKGKDDVYLARGFAKYILTRRDDFYRDRVIAKIQMDDVKSFKISDDKKVYSVEKSSAVWIFKGPKPKNFDDILSRILNINGFGFADDEKFTEKITIEIKTKDGRTHIWYLGEKKQTFYLAKRPDREDIFKITTATGDKITEFLEEYGKSKT